MTMRVSSMAGGGGAGTGEGWGVSGGVVGYY